MLPLAAVGGAVFMIWTDTAAHLSSRRASFRSGSSRR
jgi:hypothetical protein